MSKTIKVSAIQMDCKPGNIEDNLKKAELMIEKASKKGAKLVLLPELMPI